MTKLQISFYFKYLLVIIFFIADVNVKYENFNVWRATMFIFTLSN